jgi:hypothetical protein
MERKPPVEQRYYLVHQNKQKIPYEVTLAKWMKSLTEYSEGYGKDGFLSERLSPEDVEEKAITKARAEYQDNQECLYSLESAIIHTDDRKIQEKADIEAKENFSNWLEPGDLTLMWCKQEPAYLNMVEG